MKVTTFFSYKGGSGRSTTCFNTIPFLAKRLQASREFPILLIDMDIESAGMTYLLKKQDKFAGKEDVKSIIKNELRWSTGRCPELSEHPFYKYLVPAGNVFGLEDDHAVMFLGVDDKTAQLSHSDIVGDAQMAMNNVVEFATNNLFRAIVMDSAAGDQLSANLAINASDNLVVCMKMTSQFRVGTFNYLNRFALKHSDVASFIDLVLLPTVVPPNAVIDGEAQFDLSINDISKRIDDLENDFDVNVNRTFVSDRNRFGINEVIRFKWKEDVLYRISKNAQLTEDESRAYNQYDRLSEVIG